jgi:protease I
MSRGGKEVVMKALMLSADAFEDSELLVPYYRLQEAGYRVDVAAEKAGVIRGMH